MTSVQLTTTDGLTLAADVAEPPGAAVGSVVLCHPHPRYGGDRFNVMVEALFEMLPPAGFRTLRFDFRRAGGDGVAERLDLVAAIDALDGDERLSVVGYSFGAAVALATVDPRIGAIAAIAPPLAMMPAGDPGVPTLVLTPRHDQFSPPEVTEPVVGAWTRATFEVIESADHFLAGHTAHVARRVTDWLAGADG